LILALSVLEILILERLKVLCTVSKYSVAGSEPNIVLVAKYDTLGGAWSILPQNGIKRCPVVHQMMHPLTGPDNDGSTPLFLASGAPPVCIRGTMAPSSPKSDTISLSPFLLPIEGCEARKHEKNGAKKVHQMMHLVE